LVGLPALVFLIMTVLLSVGSRIRRLEPLRRCGLARAECATVLAREMGLVGGAGALVGVLCYGPVERAVGATHWAGTSWFAWDGALSPVFGLAIVCGTVLVCYLAGRAVALVKVDSDLRHGSTHGLSAKIARVLIVCLRWVAGALGVMSIGVFVFLLVKWHKGTFWGDGAVMWVMFVAGGVLIGAGLILAGPAASALARAAVSRFCRLPAAVRLGLRLSTVRQPVLVVTLLLGAVMIVTTGVWGGATRLDVVSGQGKGSYVRVDAGVGTAPRSQAKAVMALVRGSRYAAYADGGEVLRTSAQGADLGDASVIVGDCADVLALDGGKAADCAGQRYGRMTWSAQEGLTGVTPVSFDEKLHLARTEETVDIPTPGPAIESDTFVGWPTVIVPWSQADWLLESPDFAAHWRLPASGRAYDDLLAALYKRAPSVSVTTAFDGTSIEDMEGRLQQHQLVKLLTILGFILLGLSLCLAGFGSSQDQLRSMTSLELAGVTVRRLRVAAAVQRGFPIAATLGYFALVGVAFAQLFLWSGNGGPGWYWPLTGRVLITALAATIAVALVGALSVGRLRLGVPDTRE
jgi:hypothetical protein